MSHQKPKPKNAPASSPSSGSESSKKPVGNASLVGVKKDRVVTDKTREQIDEMINSVSSLKFKEASKEPADDSEPSVSDDELGGSELVQALAQTLVSEVSTSQDDKGFQFSKMSLDASLIFDDQDVDFFEKEFDATKKDIEEAKTKNNGEKDLNE